MKNNNVLVPSKLLTDLRVLIQSARTEVARQVNSSLVTLYWNIGQRIQKDILRERRAEYGQQIVFALGIELTKEFGQGFVPRNLWYMVRFAETFPEEKIVNAQRSQLG
ncbi:MAG: DUF1016 N-terminal domain-containing protein, partial [Kiritimatiellia bacterium]|nr:DUF1016 N-terminal domain-containing protein [Kiritimatiellia bacterium]